MFRMILMLCLLVSALAAHAQTVYRCVDDKGVTTFSQAPCAIDAEEVKVRTYRPREEDADAAQSRVDEIDDARRVRTQQIEITRQRRVIDQKIAFEEADIDRLEARRDAELAALQGRQRTASNNIAGAAYLQSISTEMQAVVSRYESQISGKRAEIARLRAQRP